MGERERVNILLVVEDPAKLLSYEAILSELEENLIKATSGREALTHLLQKDMVVAVDYLTVPFLPELLRAKVRVFVEHYRCRQALAHAHQRLQPCISVHAFVSLSCLSRLSPRCCPVAAA